MFSRSDVYEYISGLLQFDLAHGREAGTWYKYHNHVYGVGYLAEKIAISVISSWSKYMFLIGCSPPFSYVFSVLFLFPSPPFFPPAYVPCPASFSPGSFPPVKQLPVPDGSHEIREWN